MDPRGTVARILKRDFIHTCSYTQNRKALGLVVLEKNVFFLYVFLIVSLWELMTPGRGYFRPKEHG